MPKSHLIHLNGKEIKWKDTNEERTDFLSASRWKRKKRGGNVDIWKEARTPELPGGKVEEVEERLTGDWKR